MQEDKVKKFTPLDIDKYADRLIESCSRVSDTAVDSKTKQYLLRMMSTICIAFKLNNIGDGMLVRRFLSTPLISSCEKLILVVSLLSSKTLPEQTIDDLINFLRNLPPEQRSEVQLLPILIMSYLYRQEFKNGKIYNRSWLMYNHVMREVINPVLFDALDKSYNHVQRYPGICWSESPAILLLLNKENVPTPTIHKFLATANLSTILNWYKYSELGDFVHLINVIDFYWIQEIITHDNHDLFMTIKAIVEKSFQHGNDHSHFLIAVLQLFLRDNKIKFELCLEHPEILESSQNLNLLLLYPSSLLEFLINDLSSIYRSKRNLNRLPHPRDFKKCMVDTIDLSNKILQFDFSQPDWILYDCINSQKINKDYFSSDRPMLNNHYCEWGKLLNYPEICKSIKSDGDLVKFSKRASLHFRHDNIDSIPCLRVFPQTQRAAIYLSHYKDLHNKRLQFLHQVPDILTLNIKDMISSKFMAYTSSQKGINNEMREAAVSILKKVPLDKMLSLLNCEYQNVPMLAYLSCLNNDNCIDYLAEHSNHFDTERLIQLFQSDMALQILLQTITRIRLYCVCFFSSFSAKNVTSISQYITTALNHYHNEFYYWWHLEDMVDTLDSETKAIVMEDIERAKTKAEAHEQNRKNDQDKTLDKDKEQPKTSILLADYGVFESSAPVTPGKREHSTTHSDDSSESRKVAKIDL